MHAYKNILIIRTDRIGDVVLTTPAIHALRKTFPQARLTMLVTAATRDLVLGNPDLDEILVDDRQSAHRGHWGFLKLIQNVRNKNFDLAVNFHTKRRTNLLCFLARVPQRIGYRNEKFGFLLTHQIPDGRSRGIKHETEYCLDVVKALGAEDSSPKTFVPLQREAEAWAERFLTECQLIHSERIVAVHPGASCPTRQWPTKNFIELIKRVTEKYSCPVLLIGGADLPKVAPELMEQLPMTVINLTGKTSLAQLVSILKRCRLLISNDSGPVHLADAIGTPVVSIFTRNQPGINPERWRPLGERSRVVVTPFQGSMSFAKGEKLDPKYLELIPVEEVLEAVDALYKLC